MSLSTDLLQKLKLLEGDEEETKEPEQEGSQKSPEIGDSMEYDGKTGKIIKIDPETGDITLRFEDDKTVTFSPNNDSNADTERYLADQTVNPDTPI